MSIKENIEGLRRTLPKDVTMVAVSKTHPASMIMEAYNAGQRIFGENRPQELREKYDILPKDIQWHFIGMLQTNKVKYLAPFVSLIHSVDSAKLLGIIEKEAAKNERIIDVLFEIHVAQEESKHGWSFENLIEYLNTCEYGAFKNVRIRGVMGMATFTDNKLQIEKEFTTLRKNFEYIKDTYFQDNQGFDTVSMGMTGDYQIAIASASNMVRIGSYIFGER